jgi:uncharacterized protein YjiS (DUF1127 family)
MLMFQLPDIKPYYKFPAKYSGHRKITGPARVKTWREIINFWIERSRQRRALGKLDQRELDDVGISREDAARETMKHFWR